jgi:hypothetical protein
MTTPDYRALCVELLDKFDLEWRARERIKAALAAEVVGEQPVSQPYKLPELGEVAELVTWLRWHGIGGSGRIYGTPWPASQLTRAADLLERLAPQPVPEGPSKAELRQLFLDHSGYIDDEPAMFWSDFYASARAVLARWGQS